MPALQFDIAAQQCPGIVGNAIAHRLGHRANGTDCGNAKKQSHQKNAKPPHAATYLTAGKAPCQ